MNTHPMKSTSPLLWVTAVVAMAAGLWLATGLFAPRETPVPAALTATILPEPRPLAPFGLVDHHGAPFTNRHLEGHWSLAFFGYTHCPDVCPTTMALLASLTKDLASRYPDQEPFQVVFFTVDPERDTPEQLAGFVPYFNRNFTGVTGTRAAVDALTANLGVLHARSTEQGAAGGYSVDHTASIFLFDPAGRLAALFSPPHDVGTLAADLVTIKRYFGSRQ